MSGAENGYEYDVCLSFAGEQRRTVEHVAAQLRGRGIRVYYDAYEQIQTWGVNLFAHLDHVYRESARYCIVFVSADYAAKAWPRHELQSAQERALHEPNEYLLPVRFDDTRLPGLHSTIGYVDFHETGVDRLVDLIAEKVGRDRASVRPAVAPLRLIDPRQSRVVLLGTSVYTSPVLANVPQTAQNLYQLGQVFDEDLPAGHCIRIDERTARDPGGVVRALRQASADARDTLLVYCAGRALYGPDAQLHLGVADTGGPRPWERALPVSALRDLLTSSRAANRILVVDCLVDGADAFGVPIAENAELLNQLDIANTYTLATLSSTPAEPTAMATPFSADLITVLRDGIPDGPELLSLTDVTEHLLRAAERTGRPNPLSVGAERIDRIALRRNPAQDGPPMRWQSGQRPISVDDYWAAQAPRPGFVSEPALRLNLPPDLVQRLPLGPDGIPQRVAYSPDGLVIAAVTGMSEIFRWRAADGRPLGVLRGQAGAFLDLAWSPDSRLLALGCLDATVQLWEPPTGRHVATLRGPTQQITAVAFAPDGSLVAASAQDGSTHLWSMSTMRPYGIITGHTGPVHDVAFAPDGQTLATAGADGTVGLWHPATGQLRIPLRSGQSTSFLGVDYDAKGRLAAHDGHGYVHVWTPDYATLGPFDTTRRRFFGEGPSEAERHRISGITFIPETSLIACSTFREGVKLLDIDWSHSAEGREKARLLGGRREPMVPSTTASPDGRYLAGPARNEVLVWEIRTPRL